MQSSNQGISPDRYMVIPRTLIFLTLGEKVLLIKGASTKRIWANRFNGIGGHIERGEDPLTAARRELREETGLVIDDLWLCAVVFVDTGPKPGVGIFVFRGECIQGKHNKLSDSEEGTLSWKHKDELKALPLVEDLYILLPKIFELKSCDPPLFIVYRYDQGDHLVIDIQ